MSRFSCEGCHAPHESAANAENVYVHPGIINAGEDESGTIPTMDNLQMEIASAAAALVVDEGMDYGRAKVRALKTLGLPPRTALPDNQAVEAAVREHIALFHADSQPAELLALRELALHWMDRLAEFEPMIGGAVWHGTATRLSDIYLQLFSDDPKAVELALINWHVEYDATSVKGLHGQPVEALSVQVRSEALQAWVGLHLLVNDSRSLRGALLPDELGRKPRGNMADLRNLLKNGESECP